MINNFTVNLTASAPTSSYSTKYGPFIIKGLCDVTFNLTGLVEETNPITIVQAFYGDGDEYIDTIHLHNTLDDIHAIEIMTSGKPKCVTQEIIHTYTKSAYSTVTHLTANILVSYLSSVIGTHNIEFKHVQDSFYSTAGAILPISSQMLSVSSNDIIVNAVNSRGDLAHVYISKNALNIPAVSASSVVHLSSFITKNKMPLISKLGILLVPQLSA